MSDVQTGPPSAGVDLQAFVVSVRRLPLIPAVAVQLACSVQQDDISVTELSRQIGADSGLSAHLMRLVNSPFYGLNGRIGTVADALALLGFNLVRRVVMATVLRGPMLARLPDTPATRDFWRDQLTTAALARWVHSRKGDDEEVAFMAGLLHDVGRLAMFVHWPNEYAELLQRPITEEDLAVDTERARFGFDHARAGGALLKAWSLPESIALAVAAHADAVCPNDPLAASVWQANRMAHLLATEPAAGGPQQPWMLEAQFDASVRHQIVTEVDTMMGSPC